MPRRPNAKTTRDQPGLTLVFAAHLFAMLKRNASRGGMQDMEHWLLDNTRELRVHLDPKMLDRLIRYCKPGRAGYGSGGPNGRIRACCIPALRAAGIELLPGLSA